MTPNPVTARQETKTPRRPRDAAGTRERIEAAARLLFAEQGYRATTVAGIAALAQVSPNLIARYFGSKDGLFLIATRPALAADEVYAGDVNGLGHRLANSIISRWTAPTYEDPMLALLRSAGERAEAAVQLARFLDEHSLGALQLYFESQGLPCHDAERRAAAIDALILGFTVRRRILADQLGDLATLHRSLSESIQLLATSG